MQHFFIYHLCALYPLLQKKLGTPCTVLKKKTEHTHNKLKIHVKSSITEDMRFI